MFEFLRKFLLLMLLFVVGLSTYLSAQNATDWRETLWVELYPINGDGTEAATAYMETLNPEQFLSIEKFMQREVQRYQVDIERPVRIVLGPELTEKPPKPPFGESILSIARWSLELRWWTYSATSDHPGPKPDIKLFLIFHDPLETPMLEHSVGLEKGRVGIVNVFAARNMAESNNFVIAHEMLHTLGASDKYGPPHMLPLHPHGYAEPDKMPRYPQRYAELMGGRIPLSPQLAVIPDSLKQARIGPESALEIRLME